jgi:putative ABC transport system permease protein
MIKNYFKIAFRNLGRNKSSSFINIGGLAVGMAVAILIGLWIFDEMSYNKYHQNYNRIARVMQHGVSNGIVFSGVAMPLPLGKELETNYGDNFKHIVMASWEGGHILSQGDKKLSKNGIYMDKDGAKLLSLKMLKGTADGLKDPGSILLSASTAKAIFADSEPVGQLMKIDNKLDVKVTGVYDDIPYSNQFRDLKFIAPWELYVNSENWIRAARDESQWSNNSFQLFVQIADNTDFVSVEKKIRDVKLKHVEPEYIKYKPSIFLHPMRDWHLRSHWDDNGIKTGGAIEYVWLFAIIGVFVLLLACINFMNLSTARSERRAKEVGIRKAIGSERKQLIGQFYSESLLVVGLSFVISILIVQLALPWFNGVAAKKMFVPWSNPLFWLMCIAFTLLTGIIAGSYPALYLSSFKPIRVLKGTFKVGKLAALPRKVLVVLQFSISLSLIIGTIIIYKQVQHSKDRPIGYSRDGLVMVPMSTPDFYGKFDVLRTDLKNSGAILELAESSSPVTAVWSSNDGFTWQGMDPNLDVDFATIWVTHEFGKTVGWTFKEGRDFSREFSMDTSSIVINEAAVKFMNIKNPVGTLVRRNGKDFKIIGVINDMIMESPYEPVNQAVYFLDYGNVNWINLKLNPAKSASESMTKIEAVFKKHIPSVPFDYRFADLEFAAKFAAEERIGKLATFFAALAIFISCLGLFGLASFMAEQRTKEIGVRKVLGASVANLWRLLSKDFVVLVTISCFIAAPLAYYFMSQWLLKYNYRTGISWWVFLAAGGGAMVITLLTVSYQAIKAALMNPVKSLRTE